jgi:TP901 family phage tail tape measure protein
MPAKKIVLQLTVDDKGKVVLDQLGDKAAKTGRKISNAGARAGTGWEKLKKNIFSVRTAILSVGSTLVLRDSISEIKNFETALIDMGKVTQRSFKNLREDILSISPEVGTSTELMRGYYQVISAGVTEPRKALETLVTASKAAKAAHVDQAEVIKGLTKVMAGFEGTVKDVTEASDLLFTTERLGQTSVAELIPVIGSLAKISRDMGISADEMAGSLALITQTAGTTSEAATRYTGLVVGMMKPTTDLTQAFNDLGFANAQAAIQQLGFIETLKQLHEWAGGGADKLAKLLGRKEGLLALSALKADNFKTVVGLVGEMGTKAGSTEKAFKEWIKTLEGVWSTLKSKVLLAIIETGEDALPKLKDGLQWFIDNFDTIQSGFGKVWNVIAAVPKGVLQFFKDYRKELKETQDEIDKITEPSPWEKFLGYLPQFGDDFLSSMKLLLTTVGEILATMVASFIEAFKTMIDFVINAIPEVWKIAKGTIFGNEDLVNEGKRGLEKWEKVGQQSADNIKLAFTTAWEGILDATEKAFDEMTKSRESRMQQYASTAKKDGEEIGKNLGEGIKDGVEKTGGGIPVAQDIIDEWKKMSVKLTIDTKKIGLDSFSARMKDINKQADMLREKFGKIPGALKEIDKWETAITDELKKQREEKTRELELSNELAKLEIQRYEGIITEQELIKKQLELHKEILEIKEKELELIDTSNAEGELLYQQMLKVVNELRKQIAELTKGAENFTKTWDEGVIKGLKDFVEESKITFDEWVEIGKQGAQTLSDSIVDIMYGNFEDGGERIKDFFKDLLRQLIQQAIANPIIVNVVGAFRGIMGGGGGGVRTVLNSLGGGGGFGGGGFGGGGFGGIGLFGGVSEGYGVGFSGGEQLVGGYTSPSSAAMGTALSYAGAAFAGYGIGSMIGTKDIRSQTGGAIGAMGGMYIGAKFGSIWPGVGTIIGAVLGALIGGLFGKGSHRQRTQIAQMDISKMSQEYIDQYSKFFEGEGGFQFAIRHPESLGEEMVKGMYDIFNTVRESLRDVMEGIGADLSKFDEAWTSAKSRISEDADWEAVFDIWIRDYTKFITGLDPAEFQKAGESMVETVMRIIQAFKDFPIAMQSIEDTIALINIDPLSKRAGIEAAAIQQRIAMDTINRNIEDMIDALDEMTDPSDAIAFVSQLQQLIVQRYQQEINYVLQLQAAIDQLGIAILQTEKSLVQFMINTQNKIESLLGVPSTVAEGIRGRIPDFLTRFNAAQTPQARLDIINFGMSMVNQMLQSRISEIQNRYAPLIEAAQRADAARQRAAQAEIQNLQQQLQVIEAWKSLVQSIDDTLLNLKTSIASPQDVFERLGIQKAEIDRVMALYQAATGEEKLGYAQQLQALLLDYLQIGQEAYTRPSSAYQAIYDMVIKNLELIKQDAEEATQNEQNIQQQIVAATRSAASSSGAVARLTAEMNAEIEEANEEAAGFFKWLQEQGLQAHLDLLGEQKEEQTTLREKLETALGGAADVAAFIAEKQRQAVEELENIKDKLQDIFDAITGVPEGQTGIQSVPYTGLYKLHQGEEVIPSGGISKSGNKVINITLSPVFNVQASGEVDEEELAEAITEKMKDMVKYDGELRDLIGAP